MPSSDITFQTVSFWNPDEVVALYRSAGWWDDAYDIAGIPPLILHSFRFVICISDDEQAIIAMGRILSDSVKTGIIQDLCVLPKYQGKGIGRGMLNHLVDVAREGGISRLFLVAQPGTESFYEKSGFIRKDNLIFFLNSNPR